MLRRGVNYRFSSCLNGAGAPRRNEALCNLPVIVLTTAMGGEEILKTYKLRCSSCIAKPVHLDQNPQQ
jgi:hypothetical protein